MNGKFPQTEAEYRAFLAKRAADPVTAAQDAALLEYACTMPCPQRKAKRERDWDNPQDVIDAVAKAQRSAGWNNRRGDVQAFTLPNRWGHDSCRLYVVPARVWAYRQWERQTAERRRVKA